ncbi:hypothetical protein NVP1215B_064 [Vibrio phage 1.215.B._10N.222.54.F7]|nr:hypothetical protein NVP1215A_064 [Vibrio phage 1.215.A._10N.222.54.F7]AUR96087.1 hypothetical protein NVP1215B_064 [Vibrio phage 1.215.B._10N.222.54.F7]
MGARVKAERLILIEGTQYNIKTTYAPDLVELYLTLTNRTGTVLGTATVYRHFYFTFEIHKARTRKGKRRLSKITTAKDPKEYGLIMSRWLVKQHTPRYSAKD